MRVILHMGVEGLSGYLLPIVMVVCGFLLWFNPEQRLFYSILVVVLSLGSWITSNLGGFIIGMILGVVGGSLAFGWGPGEIDPLTTPRRRLDARDLWGKPGSQ